MFGPSYWKFGVTIDKVRILQVKSMGEQSRILNLRWSPDIQVEMLISYVNLELREAVQPEDINLESIGTGMTFEAMRLH